MINILGGIVSYESASPLGLGDATKPVYVGNGAGFAWGPITNNSSCLRTLTCSNNSTLYGYNTANNVFNGLVKLDSGNVNLSGVLSVTNGIINSYNGLIFSNVLNGIDAVTLHVGDTYAFGLLNTSGTPDFNFLRASGTQPDPNGAPFQILTGGLTGTSATVPGYGGSPRNLFVGVYTTSVPEPASIALLG